MLSREVHERGKGHEVHLVLFEAVGVNKGLSQSCALVGSLCWRFFHYRLGPSEGPGLALNPKPLCASPGPSERER